MNPLWVILSASPLLVILLLMVGFRWNLIRTGVAAWCWTLAVAVLAFGTGLAALTVSQAKALLLALDVLPIVWGALLFYVVCEEAGVIQTIGDGLAGAVPWKSLRGLLLAWAFASFLQGAGGFGVPVVITAPLMLASGFTPAQAMVLPFIGHAWAVTFGSLGTSFQALMSSSRLGADALAAPSALMLGVLCLLSGVIVGLLVSEKGEFPRLLPIILFAGSAMGATQYLLAVSGFWQVASLGAGLIGLLVIFTAGRLIRKRDSAAPYAIDRKFILGLSSYMLLIGIVLCARWFAPLREALGALTWKFSLPEASTSLGYITAAETGSGFAPLGHPGALLLYASAAVFLWFRRWEWYQPKAAGRILQKTVRQAVPVSIGILLMVGVSTILSYSGMTARLAEGLSASVGAAFPAVAPWLGGIGAFLTGSNTNSNLLFAPLQQQMARTLGVEEKILLAAQTSGGAVGSVLSPAKVGVGVVAIRDGLGEGDVMRKLLLPLGLLLAAASICTVLLL
jgi:lactate permease